MTSSFSLLRRSSGLCGEDIRPSGTRVREGLDGDLELSIELIEEVGIRALREVDARDHLFGRHVESFWCIRTD